MPNFGPILKRVKFPTTSCNAPPQRSPGAFVYEPVGRDPLGSAKKRVKYTVKRTIVIQTDRCALKTQNSSLTRPFCSNRLLFGGDDGDDGDGRCGVVDFLILFSSCHNSQHVNTRAGACHTISYHDRSYIRHYLTNANQAVTQTTQLTHHNLSVRATTPRAPDPSVVPITYLP